MSVPVLSVQITVAAPIVSHACNLRTRLFSCSILRILKARLTELFSGNGGKDIVFYVSDGKPLGAFGEEMRDFMDNVLKMLSE